MGKKNLKTFMKLPYLVFSPNDLMESLLMSVVMDKCKPCYASSSDLEIYKLYDVDNNGFLGTCYALKYYDTFYANIQGSDVIFSFDKDTFKVVKTDELWLPIEVKDDCVMFVVCKFEQLEEGYCIYPLSIKKASKPLLLETSDVHVFNERISVLDAIDYFAKNFATK